MTKRILTSVALLAVSLQGQSSIPIFTIDGPTLLPIGTKGAPYSGFTFSASGAVGLSPRLFWRVQGLPPGMALNNAVPRIAGTPTAAGLFLVQVNATQLGTANPNGSSAPAAVRGRTFTLFIREAGVAYTAAPLDLRFDFSATRRSAEPRSIEIAGLPAGNTLLAAACDINGRIPALGYPRATAQPEGRTRVNVAVTFSDNPPDSAAPCPPPSNPASRGDNGEVVAILIEGGGPTELFAEVRIYSEIPGPRVNSKPGGRESTIQAPDYRVLVRIAYLEPPALVAPKEITFRFNRTRPDLLPPPRVIPVVSRDLVGRSFSVTPRVVSPDNVPDWLRVTASDNATPGAVTVDIVNPARLPPGVYLAMLEFRITAVTKAGGGARAAEGEPDARTGVLLKIGPGNDFKFDPGEYPITDPALENFEVTTVRPQTSRPNLNMKTEIVDGVPGWLSVIGTTVLPGAAIKAKVAREGLGAGVYTGYIAVWDPRGAITEGAAAELKVTLKIGDGTRIVTDPPSVEVQAEPGATTSQPVEVTGDDGAGGIPIEGASNKGQREARIDGIPFEPRPQQGAWLSVEPLGTATPATFRLSANTRGLAAGRSYAAAVSIDSGATINPVEIVPVSLTVRSAAATQARPSRVVPRIINGDGWRTFMTVVNPENRRLITTVRFWTRQGIAGQQTPRSLNVEYQGAAAALTFLRIELEPLGNATVATTGLGLLTDDTWASFDEPVHGQIAIRRAIPGKAPFEAAMPLTDSIPSGSYLFFDNTGNTETSVSLLNPGSSTGGFQITARNLDGKTITRCQFGVTSFGRVQGTRVGDLMPATRGQRGSLEIVTLGVTGNNSCRDEDTFDPEGFVPGGPMSIMGLREHRDGSIAYLAPIVQEDFIDRPGRRIVPLTANGGGWETDLWMLNLEFDSNPVFFEFHRSNGDPIDLTTASGVRRRVSASTAPLSTVRLATTRPGSESVLGWTEMPASSSFAGQAILRRLRSSGDTVETHASAVQPPKSRWRGYFDQSGGYTNQIVLTNPSGRPVTSTMSVRDGNGREAASVRVDVGPFAQEAVDLAARLRVAAGSLGTIEVAASNGDLLAVGLRINPAGDLATSFPMF